MPGSLCLVTVHGIGFQQPPNHGRPGYADALHENLRVVLPDRLGDDPERTGHDGPVYVSSEWDGSPRDGLARLDPHRPLAAEGRIAHVALVYAPSEPLEDRPGSVADAVMRAAIMHRRYATATKTLRLIISDARAALLERRTGTASPTLRRRDDMELSQHHRRLVHWLHQRRHGVQPVSAPSSSSTPGAFGTLRALEDDVATYVVRNDLRERVRSFVEAALLGLLDRPDVSGLVVNAHSQGTLVCWDVLCRLPFYSWSADGDRRARLVRSLITAGSPIRKYVDMYAWGGRVGELADLVAPGQGDFSWHNFWDPRDPVADPLDPAGSWHPGKPLSDNPASDDGLLVARDPAGRRHHVNVIDTQVDNVHNSGGGGLQAHDYWNNQQEFVKPLGGLLAGLDRETHVVRGDMHR